MHTFYGLMYSAMVCYLSIYNLRGPFTGTKARAKGIIATISAKPHVMIKVYKTRADSGYDVIYVPLSIFVTQTWYNHRDL